MSKPNFWDGVKAVLSAQQVKDALKNLIIKALKLQVSGGFRAWLIRIIVTEFADELIGIASRVSDYLSISKKMDDTINNEDRNEATDDLNDVMRGN